MNTSTLLELMLLKEMSALSHQSGKDSPIKSFEEITKWLKERDDLVKKEKDKKPVTPTFSPGQMLFIVLGLSPFVGMGAMIGQAHLFQMLLDSVRAIH